MKTLAAFLLLNCDKIFFCARKAKSPDLNDSEVLIMVSGNSEMKSF